MIESAERMCVSTMALRSGVLKRENGRKRAVSTQHRREGKSARGKNKLLNILATRATLGLLLRGDVCSCPLPLL